jgi:hypothetical protein
VAGAEVEDLVQLDIAADQLGNRLREVRGRAGGGGVDCGIAALGRAEAVRTPPVNW